MSTRKSNVWIIKFIKCNYASSEFIDSLGICR